MNRLSLPDDPLDSPIPWTFLVICALILLGIFATLPASSAEREPFTRGWIRNTDGTLVTVTGVAKSSFQFRGYVRKIPLQAFEAPVDGGLYDERCGPRSWVKGQMVITEPNGCLSNGKDLAKFQSIYKRAP